METNRNSSSDDKRVQIDNYVGRSGGESNSQEVDGNSSGRSINLEIFNQEIPGLTRVANFHFEFVNVNSNDNASLVINNAQIYVLLNGEKDSFLGKGDYKSLEDKFGDAKEHKIMLTYEEAIKYVDKLLSETPGWKGVLERFGIPAATAAAFLVSGFFGFPNNMYVTGGTTTTIILQEFLNQVRLNQDLLDRALTFLSSAVSLAGIWFYNNKASDCYGDVEIGMRDDDNIRDIPLSLNKETADQLVNMLSTYQRTSNSTLPWGNGKNRSIHTLTGTCEGSSLYSKAYLNETSSIELYEYYNKNIDTNPSQRSRTSTTISYLGLGCIVWWVLILFLLGSLNMVISRRKIKHLKEEIKK